MLSQKISITILSIVFSIISYIYFINQPIEFGCDSNVFYLYGKEIHFIFKEKLFIIFLFLIISFTFFRKRLKKVSLNKIIYFLVSLFITYFIFIFFYFQNYYEISNLQRPPFYSLFLVMSGLYNFETFNTLIFFQIILSYLSIIIFFKILFIYTNNLNLSLVFTCILALSSIPYILFKFVIAEQMLFFLSISTYYFMFMHNKTNRDVYIFISLILASLAWLTKWEGQLLFLSVSVYIILKFWPNNLKNLRKILKFILIPFLILLSWVTTRSEVIKDYSNFTSISNTNSEQFFFKFYNALPSKLYDFKKKMNLEIFDEKLNFIFDNQRQIIIIDKQNGPYSKKLYESVLDYITLNPNSYKGYEKILEDAYQYNDRNYDLYSELFGKFDNDARFLTENIFSQPNIWYYTYINAGLEKFVGKDEKDKLFKNSIFEGLRTNSSIFLLFFSDFLQASGINFEKYFYYNKIPIGSISDLNFVTPFNAGKCASQNLSRKKFEEYKSSH